MKAILIALVGAVIGAAVTLVGVYWFTARGEIGFRVTYLDDYRDVELLSYELRDGGILVRCRNNGTRMASTPSFRLRTKSDRGATHTHLIMGRNDIPAGGTAEQIVPLDDVETQEHITLTTRHFELDFQKAAVQTSIRE